MSTLFKICLIAALVLAYLSLFLSLLTFMSEVGIDEITAFIIVPALALPLALGKYLADRAHR